ncbi:MAG: PKD domain-containing protein, partial [Bacteroidia bacterium]|nr:PKD domain-containing protein [Bacteroidia bacterium]
ARHGGTFVENKGQTLAEARFEAAWGAHRVYLTPEGIALLLTDPTPFHKAHFQRWGPPLPVYSHFIRISWVGGNAVEPFGIEPETTRYHFFQGDWQATDVRGFRQVSYKGIYPGVEALFTLTPQGLKWDWIVANPSALKQIRLRYEGASLAIQGDSLYIETSIGTFPEALPRIYEKHTQKPLRIRYHCEGAYISYELLEPANGPLIIDPVVVFSTFSGSFSDNWGFTATYDLEGNAFAGGNVNDFVWRSNPGQIRFPVTPGAVQGTFGGGVDYPSNAPIFWSTDMALWKVNPTGTTRLWATYLGGSNNEQPHSLVCDAAGNLYLMGATRSTNFPTTPRAYQTTSRGGIEIVVACINSTGNLLLGSTYIGGSGEDGLNSAEQPLYYFYADDGRGEIFLSDTLCYIISSTRSANFPTTANAYQRNLRGSMDAVICAFSLDLRHLYASTYLGGNGADAGYSLRIHPSGRIYAAGGTNSTNFPTTPNAYQPSFRGGRAEGWLVALDTFLTQIIYGTYWGTNQYDQVFMIDIDRQGNLWGAGHTEGNLTPTPNTYSTAGGKQFVFSMNAELSQILRLSIWGSPGRTTPNITISAFTVDKCGYAYVSGWGGLEISPDLPSGSTTGLPTTPNANQTTTDGQDFYLIAFRPNLSALAYASFWGGPVSDEHVDGGTSRFDPRGVIYQSVCGGCGGRSDFPTTPGVVSRTNNSTNCNNALFKIDFQLGDPVVAALTLSPPSGCAPFTATFQNLSQNGTSYYWDFGNGQTFNGATPPPITYTAPGTYWITLVAINPATCNERDTLRRRLVVLPPPNPNFTPRLGCDLSATFIPADSSVGNNYFWSFGDGGTSNLIRPTHTYSTPGTYTVKLVITNANGCKDSSTQTIRIQLPSVRAGFTWQGDPCLGRYTFLNQSQNATYYVWIIGTDTLRNVVSPTYAFPTSGTYIVTLIAYDERGCSDTLRRLVPVSRQVRANFTPRIQFCNLSVTFENTSQGAGSYQWNLGDGTTSTQTTLTHIYAAPGIYEVQLVAIAPDGLCRDTLRRTLDLRFISEAIAEVRADPCRGGIRLISRSRGAERVWWIIQGDTLRSDSTFWQAPGPGRYFWQLITNPGYAPFCQDTLTGEVEIPLRQRADSIPWSADICAGYVFIQLPILADQVLSARINGIPFLAEAFPLRLPLSPSQGYDVQIIYRDNQNCPDTLRTLITPEVAIARYLFIPTAFTPNGDGINDEFRIIGGDVCIEGLWIYDRWGKEVYATRTAPFSWSGKDARGNPLPEGAYVFVVFIKGFRRAGTVTMVR